MVVIAPGFHLFPSRTEMLSPCTPMVLLLEWESRSPPVFRERGPLRAEAFEGPLFFVISTPSFGRFRQAERRRLERKDLMVNKVFKGSEVGIKGERHFIIVAIGLSAFVSRK